MTAGVRTERIPPLLEVVIDRPKANALDAAASRRLAEAFGEFRDDDELRVAILTGAGERFFSAGWDLAAAAEGEEYEADFGPGGFGGFPELPGLNKPVICAVNGIAVGGGFEIVLAADLVVAADHAQFWLPEAFLGFLPDAGLVRLPRRLPEVVAREMLLTGRRMDAAEALRWGIVNQVVSSDQLPDAARRLAHRIAEAAPLAVEALIDLLRRTAGGSREEAFGVMRSGEVDSYRRMLDSDDAREGPRAFAEKREPRWTGK